MRGMQQQLGNLGTISAFACTHRENKENLCRGGRSQDLPDTDWAKKHEVCLTEQIRDKYWLVGNKVTYAYVTAV